MLSLIWTLSCTLAFYSIEPAVANNDDSNNCNSARSYDRTFSFTQDILESPLMKYSLNTAVNRAIFYSVMYNWTAYAWHYGHGRFSSSMNENDYDRQPGLNYLYMSTSASVHAGPEGVETSGLLFDTNSSYPNWLPDVPFNSTLRLFGIRSDHALIKDLGSTADTDYTNDSVYPQNAFYHYLRDSNIGSLHQHRTYYMNVHRPGSEPTERMFAVNKIDGQIGAFTRPFYDCQLTNTWLINAVSMATEVLPRASFWLHLLHLKSVAASTVGVSVDTIQAIAAAPGRTPPSTARINQARRILSAHDADSCSGLQTPNPPIPLASDIWQNADLANTLEVEGRAALRLSHFLSNFLQNNDYADNQRHQDLMHDAWMNYGYREPLPTFAPMVEIFVDRPLYSKQLSAEVFALIMSNEEVKAAGIFLDAGVFSNRSGPVSAFAWKSYTDLGEVMGNVADLYAEGDDYTTKTLFAQAKQAYTQITRANTQVYSTDRELRTSRYGIPRRSPQTVRYAATTYDQGTWTSPRFECGPRLSGWVTSYVTPIFVRGLQGPAPIFGGVVKVDVAFTEQNISA